MHPRRPLISDKVTVKFARANITSANLPGREMYYVINQQLCVVCYRVADMPTVADRLLAAVLI